MSNVLVWLMVGFLAGLFARKAGDFVETFVKHLSGVRLEIDIHSDRPALQPSNVRSSLPRPEGTTHTTVEPLQIPARTGRRKRTHRRRIDSFKT